MPSKVWNFFNKVDGTKAKCKQCDANVKYCGNTTNLHSHIKSKHPNLAIQLVDEATGNKQPRIDDLVAELNSIKGGVAANAIKEAIVWFIVGDFQPFSVVESEAFIQMFKIACKHFKMPGRKSITQLANRIFINKKELIKTHLKMINYLSLSCDLWTDEHNSRSFIGLTCHFIDNYTSQSICLAVKHMNVSHTSDHIVIAINEVLEDFEIGKDKITSIVTDGAPNIANAAGRICPSPIWCVAHKLNLVVTDSIGTCGDTRDICSKIRLIVKLFKQSNNLNDLLKNLQTQDGVLVPLKLKQDVITRWNSTYLMIDRYLQLKSFTSMALIRSSREDMDIPFYEMDFITDIKGLLEPFFKVTVDISGESYVTVSRVIPVINMLKHCVKSYVTKSEAGKKFQTVILRNLDQRFGNIESFKRFSLATILDPRFKKIDFMSPSNCAHAITEINNLLQFVPLTQEVPDISQSPTDSLWELHDRRCNQLIDSEVGLNSGLKHYLSLPNLKLNADPLDFWKRNKENWHELHNLAIKYLTTTATSVPCERLFSKAGYILNERRSRLDAKNVDMLCFLKSLPHCFKY